MHQTHNENNETKIERVTSSVQYQLDPDSMPADGRIERQKKIVTRQ
jgi:hypothetical protein